MKIPILLSIVGLALAAQQPNNKIEIPIRIGCAALPEGFKLDTDWKITANFIETYTNQKSIPEKIDLGQLTNESGGTTFHTLAHQKSIPLITRATKLYLSNSPLTKFTIRLDIEKIKSKSGYLSFVFSGQSKLIDPAENVVKEGPVHFRYDAIYPNEIGIQGYLQIVSNMKDNVPNVIFSPIFSKEQFIYPKSEPSKP